MGSSARFQEKNLRLFCARNEINLFIEFFQTISVRSALPCILSGSGSFWLGALRNLNRRRERVCNRFRGGLDQLAGFRALVE